MGQTSRLATNEETTLNCLRRNLIEANVKLIAQFAQIYGTECGQKASGRTAKNGRIKNVKSMPPLRNAGAFFVNYETGRRRENGVED